MVHIKEITIKDFRLIKELSFQPSKYINIISGKNGTGKSTILGMIAQGFSFNNKVVDFISEEAKQLTKPKVKDLDPEMDSTLLNEYNSILTLFGNNFESESNEHFKLSDKDGRNTEHINIVLDNNRFFRVETTNHNDRKLPRFVTRRDDNESSNYVHPVIYLGLDRLTPLVRTKNTNINVTLSEDDIKEIHTLYESILLKKYPKNLSATKTNTNKHTAAYINTDRTIEMISSGEDIVGQLLLSLYSFKKLKDNFPDYYNGGILLIDEIDSTLYPAAQNVLLDVFLEKARAFNIQIFATSHSLTLLEHLESEKLNNPRINRDVKIFTTDETDITDIKLNELEYLYKFKNQLLVQANKKSIPDKINVYFEDNEAYFIFSHLLTGLKDSNNSPVKQRLKLIKDIGLSCSNYTSLHKNKIPEFTTTSIICLDGDQLINTSSLKNFITLPNHGEPSNPEEFIFDILNDSSSDFWKQTDENYNHSIFMNNSKYRVLQSIKDGTYTRQYQETHGTYKNTKPREVWKKWFNTEKDHWKGKNNPIKYWTSSHPEEVKQFEKNLKKVFDFVATNNKIPNL